LRVGIVGLPNAGKSTLFNALLQKQQALAASYPFATIEPNVGIVPVPDQRLMRLAEIVAKGNSNEENLPPIVPSVVEFYDIAGLVAGAHKGEGLGNKFLSHIREVELIVHVIRYFEDGNVVKTGKSPRDDFETVKTELILKDLETLDKQQEPKGKAEKEDKLRWEAIVKVKTGLEEGLQASEIILTEEEKELIAQLFLLTAKPAMFVLNVGEHDLNKISQIEKEHSNWKPLVICAKLESELVDFSETERREYFADNNLSETGLDRLVGMAFEQLGLISFLTAGEKEVRSWTILKGTSAVNAAGVIHTDFEKHFISAQVASFADFVRVGGWTEAKKLGLVRTEGREYVVRPDDVIEFMIGR